MTTGQPPRAIPFDNIRGLAQDLIGELDRRGDVHRHGTRYEKIRRSDVRVGVLASRQPRSMADIARAMGVTRQAVHASVKRLMELDVVELLPQPGNSRDKLVTVTERGWQAQQVANASIKLSEEECAEILGKRGLEQFRGQLLALVTALKARHVEGAGPADEDEIDEVSKKPARKAKAQVLATTLVVPVATALNDLSGLAANIGALII
jgi:DNA-binding MarR family transcriptional regulator